MTYRDVLNRLRSGFYAQDMETTEYVCKLEEACEKQFEKEPKISTGCNCGYRCPCCNKLLYWTDKPRNHGEKNKYCGDCGQRILWD